ncbi:Starch-binding associating with outer membrane [Flavobacterium aquidurense]|uniref:RagB/SusD family nutrient uptake outer membrane protein n=1 Tax=Flavobacterium frigidimaris TaxID=262320 RepID=A0ABX4BV40_FLAFR|nr:RagB/SusD family nutrient uptake outer membrane protein [Flavobacterium frigidimaris]OXA81168.1 RagB/SusD family nutrient uptake outer membrane protein [Flavobacterium frigidimaris]SDZ45238.1 Starch-binding associating with outer membrane [Flavobacterium aquidurense]
MKNTYLYIFCFSLLSLGSCSLETEPLTQLTDTNFYKTTDDAYTALVGCYDGLQVATGASGLGVPVISEVMSDDCFGGTGNSDGFNYAAIDEFDITRSPSDVDMLNGNWIAYYKALYRCNIFLSKMDQIDWKGNTTLKNTYESETKFIRAYLYFEMVRLWGNIPLLTAPSSENVPQANPDEVYKVIAQDLVFAADNLPATAYNTTTGGRITKWAAKSLLGRVYLYYTGYYGKSDLVGVVTKAQALGHLENVIANSGHGLVADFSTLWPAASLDKYAGESNKEIVFSIKYTYTSDYNGNTDGNGWLVMFGMREFSSYPYGRGWGITVNSKLWNVYDAKDTRRVATVIGIDEEKIPFDKKNSQREYTGYYNKKYSPMVDKDGKDLPLTMGSQFWDISQFQDYVVVRYADVLLMAAELGSGNAQAYFDEVRKRAYKDNFTALPVNADNILKERHLEFALEGVRYWDLLRQGIGKASSTIAETTTLLSGGVAGTKTISAAKIQATKGLQQIPNTQITLSNGVLKQNAGW